MVRHAHMVPVKNDSRDKDLWDTHHVDSDEWLLGCKGADMLPMMTETVVEMTLGP